MRHLHAATELAQGSCSQFIKHSFSFKASALTSQSRQAGHGIKDLSLRLHEQQLRVASSASEVYGCQTAPCCCCTSVSLCQCTRELAQQISHDTTVSFCRCLTLRGCYRACGTRVLYVHVLGSLCPSASVERCGHVPDGRCIDRKLRRRSPGEQLVFV